MTDKRIFDNPAHPKYGMVRRAWVMLAGMDLLEYADIITSERWDLSLAESPAPEPVAIQGIMWIVLNHKMLAEKRRNKR